MPGRKIHQKILNGNLVIIKSSLAQQKKVKPSVKYNAIFLLQLSVCLPPLEMMIGNMAL